MLCYARWIYCVKQCDDGGERLSLLVKREHWKYNLGDSALGISSLHLVALYMDQDDSTTYRLQIIGSTTVLSGLSGLRGFPNTYDYSI